jgi:hypothetical protein
LMDTIIHGVLHHPAQREEGDRGQRQGRSIMFSTVEEWWNEKSSREKDDLRRKLSRDGVYRGENHKEGVHDTGHGCGKLKMHKQFGGNVPETMEDKIAGAAAGAIIGGVTSGFSSIVEGQTGYKIPTPQPQQSSSGSFFGGLGGQKEESSGGLGGLLGNLIGGLGKSEDKTEYQSSGRTDDGGYQQTTTAYGRNENKYGQVEQTETSYPGGGHRSEHKEYEQEQSQGRYGGRQEQGHGYEERTETQPTYGGGYQQHTERKWEDDRGEYRREEETHSYGGGRRQENEGRGGYGGGEQQQYGGQQEYGGRQEEQQYGGRQEYGRQEEQQYGGRQEYGRQEEQQYGGRQEFGGREEGYGGRQEGYGGREGREEEEEQEGGRRHHGHHGDREGYGGGEQEFSEYGGRSEDTGFGTYGGSDSNTREDMANETTQAIAGTDVSEGWREEREEGRQYEDVLEDQIPGEFPEEEVRDEYVPDEEAPEEEGRGGWGF